MQSAQTKTSTSFGPQRPKQVGSPSTRMIRRRGAHSPMRRPRRSCGTLSSSNLESSMTQRAEVSAVISQAEGRTDKCNAELVKPAQEGSQKGVSGSRLT